MPNQAIATQKVVTTMRPLSSTLMTMIGLDFYNTLVLTPELKSSITSSNKYAGLSFMESSIYNSDGVKIVTDVIKCDKFFIVGIASSLTTKVYRIYSIYDIYDTYNNSGATSIPYSVLIEDGGIIDINATISISQTTDSTTTSSSEESFVAAVNSIYEQYKTIVTVVTGTTNKKYCVFCNSYSSAVSKPYTESTTATEKKMVYGSVEVVIGSSYDGTKYYNYTVDPSANYYLSNVISRFESDSAYAVAITPPTGYKFDHWASVANSEVDVIDPSTHILTGSTTKIYAVFTSAS